MFKYFWCAFVGVCFVLTSCSNVSVGGVLYTTTTNSQVLGSVGAAKKNVVQNNTTPKILTAIQKPLAVVVTKEFFTTKTYKAYTKAKRYQKASLPEELADSLQSKQGYITCTLSNEPQLIEALNSTTLKEYLRVNANVGILYSISMVLPAELQEAIVQADYVALAPNTHAYCSLQLVTNDKVTKTIDFKDGVVFGYSYQYPCWQENEQHQVVIAGFTEKTGGCPSNTYKKASRTTKKINYYKL